MAQNNLVVGSKAKSSITTRATFKYLGFALLFTWHYTLWFVPDMFYGVKLPSNSITYSWLIMLAASAFTLFVIPLFLGRERRLASHTCLIVIVPIILSAGTLYVTLLGFTLDSPISAYATSAILGIGSAVYWILWGEFFAQQKLTFSILHLGPVMALTILVALSMGIALFVPLVSLWTAFLPLLSGLMLYRCTRSIGKNNSFMLLPGLVTKNSRKSVIVVCLASFVASFACYFLVAVIPWEPLLFTNLNFAFGVIAGAVFILLVSVIARFLQERNNVFQMLSWLLVFIVVTVALFLANGIHNHAVFILALAIFLAFEIFLVMYFGILTSKGYVTPALAFGLSSGFICAGIACGSALALYYKSQPALALAATPNTALILLSILVVLLVLLLGQEYNISKLVGDPADDTDLKQRLSAVSQEFNLSPRESEIMALIAKGYTADTIARKLVISPHTVNTHIRHTYEKISIHKRSELLDYINTRKTS